MDTSVPLKRCSKCGEEKPETTEYFRNRKFGRNGLSSECKVCDCARCCRYYAEHREELRERYRRYYAEHAEKGRDYSRLYRAEHLEEVRESSRHYRIKHPEERREQQRRYAAEHPEERRVHEQRRRAQKLGNGGTHTADDVRLQVRSQTDKRGRLHCWWCGKVIKGDYHIDHVIPLSRGGSNGAGNIVIAHARCNLSKHDKLPQEMGRLL